MRRESQKKFLHQNKLIFDSLFHQRFEGSSRFHHTGVSESLRDCNFIYLICLFFPLSLFHMFLHTGLGNPILPFISFEGICHGQVRTHSTNAHATRDTVTAKMTRASRRQATAPITSGYHTCRDAHFCSIRCFSYCI